MIILEEFQEIRLSEHLIVLDTNILLELYRQPSNISLDIIKALKQIIKNIYVPRQVFDEYLKNCKKVCGIEKRKYQNVSKELSESVGKLQRDIASRIIEYRKHNYTDISKLQSNLDKKIEEINDIIKEFENSHKEEIEQNLKFLQNDKVKEFVELLVEKANVGKKIPFSKRMLILQEGKVRLENLIPPGYKDDEKVGVDKYGDLFIWKDIIETAQEKNANIIFLCNDIKEDWWEKDKDLPIELRKELLDEFKETNPMLEIHFLTLERFFSYIAEELKMGQSKSALQLSALEYVEKNIEQYEDIIENKIGAFFASMNTNDIIGMELLSYTDNEQIYWTIKDVSVDKEDKTIIYYINLDISILADVIYDENDEIPNNMGKLAVALDGKLELTSEEYSKENNLESIDIDIIEVYRVEPKIWRVINKIEENVSSREIIAASKILVKNLNEVIDIENLNRVGKVLQEYVKAYRLAIDPLQNCDKLVEVFEPLETASKTIKMFNIPYKVEEALKPLVEISKNLNADFKKIDMLERITETMKPLTDMGKILKISDTKDNCEDDANSRKENNLLLESIKLKDKNDEEI